MFTSFSKPNPSAAALERIRGWTAHRFGLCHREVVMAIEVACEVPGCPPIETIVAFWTEGDHRHQFKVFKAAEAVKPEDIPYAWMKKALAEAARDGCDCC